MADELKSVRVHFLMSPAEAAAIDEFRWKNRLRSHGAAIRQLVALGLAAAGAAETPKPERKPRRKPGRKA